MIGMQKMPKIMMLSILFAVDLNKGAKNDDSKLHRLSHIKLALAKIGLPLAKWKIRGLFVIGTF